MFCQTRQHHQNRQKNFENLQKSNTRKNLIFFSSEGHATLFLRGRHGGGAGPRDGPRAAGAARLLGLRPARQHLARPHRKFVPLFFSRRRVMRCSRGHIFLFLFF